jgi:uncharacterized protein GlcG (DUF336 family)
VTIAIHDSGCNLLLLQRMDSINLGTVEGGLPIIVDGKQIGSIGVSGGSSAQDDQIGKAGLAALKS